ncbi:MAG: YhcH/YjgK/YiaL family protein [Oscillospiraceae bacterium]|jgi:YhcH/YjgK/YiaL family protein
MIITNLELCSEYKKLVPDIKKAVNTIINLTEFKVGRYETDFGFYMLQEGETHPLKEGLFETHNKYLDIQIILEGEEVVEWADRNKCIISVLYDEEKDIAFFTAQEKDTLRFTAKEGMCYIVFPNDAHKPCRHIDKPTYFKKAVFKLKLLQEI